MNIQSGKCLLGNFISYGTRSFFVIKGGKSYNLSHNMTTLQSMAAPIFQDNVQRELTTCNFVINSI